MASFRQRLIELSPFLSNQKEKIGGLTVKKSTISGSAFKKGTSQESLGEVAGKESNIGKLSRILRDTRGKTLVNEKKITLLKKISNLRKDNQQEKVNSPLLESLQAIAATTDSIRNTLIQQQDNDKSIVEQMRRDKEEQERKDQEKNLEKPKLLQKLVDPVIKPVMSVWSKILKFITTLFLGKILMNFLDWFGNPENQGKIITLVRFVKDWWPALVGAVLLFGTGFGGLVTGLTVAIATFIPKMLAAITALKASKLGGKAGLIKGGLLVGGGMLAGMGISKMMDKGEGEDVSKEKVQGLNKGGQVAGSGNTDTVPAMLTPGEFVMSKGAVQKYGVDTMESMNAAAGGTNRPTMGRYETGGFAQAISDSTNAEPGRELDPFVNFAMDQMKEMYGITKTKADHPLLQKELNEENNAKLPFGMKMTADGQNIDWGRKAAEQAKMAGEMMKDPKYAQRLKEVGKQYGYENMTAEQFQEIANRQAEEARFQINRMIPGTESYRLDVVANEINQSTSQKMAGGGLVQGFQGGGLVQEYQKLKMERNRIKPGPDGKFSKEDSDRKGQLTLQMKDLYKQIQESQKSTSKIIANEKKEQEVVPAQTEDIVNKKKKLTSGSVKFTGSQLKNLLEEQKGIGSSSGILGPISSNVDAMVNTDKYEVKPKEKKNVVVAYEQEATKSKSQPENQPPAGGNDIPSFDVRPPFMTDQDKMMVLGMRV